MKTLIFLLFMTAPVLSFAQSGFRWQPPGSMLTTSPQPTTKPEVRDRLLKTQAAAARRLNIPADCLILLATLDRSDCRRPLEALRKRKEAVIILRAHKMSVEAWQRARPTAARVIAIDGDEADRDWFDLGALEMPTVIKREKGRPVGVSPNAPPN